MDIAIDLGSDRTRVFIENKGKVLDEASVVTYDIDTDEIYAVGDEAYAMIGKTPVGIKAVHPLDSGVIARSELVEDMVSILLKEVCSVKVVMPRVITAVPCDVTEVEKRAVVNAVSSFGVRKVFLIESPKAAALGCGIDITSPHGVLIADIGSGTADIAVLSLGGISVSKTVKHAGSAMDEEIVKYISEKDIDYKNIPYVRTFFNYKGGIKEAWNGNTIIEPMVYILTGRDAVDFENMYGKPVGTAQKISKQYDDERIGKLEIEQAKSAYGFGGRAYIKDSLGKFKDLITGRPLELHTIFIDGKQKKPPILLKLAFFQKDGFDNPLVTNGII